MSVWSPRTPARDAGTKGTVTGLWPSNREPARKGFSVFSRGGSVRWPSVVVMSVLEVAKLPSPAAALEGTDGQLLSCKHTRHHVSKRVMEMPKIFVLHQGNDRSRILPRTDSQFQIWC